MNATLLRSSTALRRAAATLTIGSFSLAALMGIVALLGAAEFGETEGRVLATTVVVGSASICMLSYLTTAGSRWAVVGLIGGLVALLPTVTALLLIWSDGNAQPWQPFLVGVVLAVSLAQVCLLLSVAGSRPDLELVLAGTVAAIAVVAFLVSGLVVGGIDIGDVWQLIGIVAILDVLGTVVTTAWAKFGRAAQVRVAPVPATGPRAIALPTNQVAQLDQLAAFTGRTPEDLVAEAVDRFLTSRPVS